MTEADLITRVTQEIKGLSSNFVTADYINAVDSAQEETSFALPNTKVLDSCLVGSECYQVQGKATQPQSEV
jgi:hypothetical protein